MPRPSRMAAPSLWLSLVLILAATPAAAQFQGDSPSTAGATLKELMKATSWQAHSVRGFLSGTVGKKMGLTVTSSKGQNGERSYSVKA